MYTIIHLNLSQVFFELPVVRMAKDPNNGIHFNHSVSYSSFPRPEDWGKGVGSVKSIAFHYGMR